jgi:CCCH-type zinc finger
MSYASKVRMSNLDLVNAQRKQAQPKTTNKDLKTACRTTAFVAIYDKSKSKKEKSKTQMCRSVQNGIVCKYGSRCTYAHSKEELKVQKCAFGTTCKTKYSKTNPCRFDHSEEHTPAPAERYELAQEMKSYWEQEDARVQEIVTKYRESQPKPEPFLIDLSEDDNEDENNDSIKINLRVKIPINKEPDIRIMEEPDFFDEEMKQILALMKFVVPRVVMNNTMDLFEGGRLHNVSPMDVL